MSTQLKEKKQTKEQVPSRDLQADFHFNQHIFRTVAYTAAGFGLGLVSSLLFKHKAGMTIFFAGAGAGYGGANFANELQNFRSKRNDTQIQRREGGSSQIREKLERTADNVKGDLQKAKNKVERGVEDVSGQVANKVSQTARGAEEWARNASEKAQQHFQQKEHRRGGDDDKDKDDSKSGKKDQQTQRRDQTEQKKDQKDQKKDQSEQKKDQQQTQKKDQKDQKDQKKDQQEPKAERNGPGATVKGGQSVEAKREEGSSQHRLIGDIRADQYTSKIPDQNANQGYNSPKQQWEGMNIKREDKSTGGQGKTSADKNKTVNKEGQHFQDFRSNPHEVGKAGEISDIKKDYQLNRNQAQNPDLDNQRRYVKGAQQDLHGESVKQGNNIRVNVESETKQGFQNYKTGTAPSLNKNQVNADL